MITGFYYFSLNVWKQIKLTILYIKKLIKNDLDYFSYYKMSKKWFYFLERIIFILDLYFDIIFCFKKKLTIKMELNMN